MRRGFPLLLGLLTAGRLCAQPAHPSLEEKLNRYLHHCFSPYSLLGVVTVAGIDQWRDSPYEWGQGMEGYGQRAGSRFGRLVIKDGILFGFDAMLGLDSRYHRSTRSGLGPRLRHVLANTFVSQTRSGGRTLAVPRILGAYGSGFIAATWYPDRLATTSHSLRRGSFSLAYEVPRNLLREFWPDIRRKLRRK